MNHESLCIFLNSKKASRYVNNYTSDCVFVIPPLTIPKRSKINVSVQIASIPYSFFNCDDFNNKFNININIVINNTIDAINTINITINDYKIDYKFV